MHNRVPLSMVNTEAQSILSIYPRIQDLRHTQPSRLQSLFIRQPNIAMDSSVTHLGDMGKLYSPPSFSPQASAPTQGIQCLYRAHVTFKFLPYRSCSGCPSCQNSLPLSSAPPHLILRAEPEVKMTLRSRCDIPRVTRGPVLCQPLPRSP